MLSAKQKQETIGGGVSSTSGNSDSDWENDDGFVFRRVNKPQPPPVSKKPPKQTAKYVDEQILLPTSETPMINRNKMMRKKTGARRSSLGLRGKRVSTMHNGLCPPPHETIDPEHYYRHIDANLSDPMRMRQLLIWCAEKATQKQVSSNVRKIQLDIIDQLINKQINTSWYGSYSNSTEESKAPHPLNESNARKIKQLDDQLERLAAEEKEWTNLIEKAGAKCKLVREQVLPLNTVMTDDVIFASPNDGNNNEEEESMHTDTEATQKQKQALNYALDTAEVSVDSTYLSEQQKQDIEEWNKDVSGKIFESWAANVKIEIECNLHRLQYALHRSQGYDECNTKKFCDQISRQMLRAYTEREQKELMSNKVESMQLLKMLSKAPAE